MKEEIFVTGHKNPDSDSICAALAYSEFKNKKGDYNAIPVRLGDISKETRFILDYFGLEAPIFKETIKPQVEDIEIDSAYCVSKEISLNKALRIMQNNNINTVTVVDEEEVLKGIVSLSNITKCYMEIWDDGILGRSNTSLENIVEVLAGNLVYEPEKRKEFGNISVYAMAAGDVQDKIKEKDLVIVGNRVDAQEDAIKRNISVLVVAGGSKVEDSILELAKEYGVVVIETEYNSYMAARLLPQAVPIEHVMTTEELVYFHKEDFVEDAKATMGKTRYRIYPVVDSKHRVVGTMSRYHLISNQKKKLILVDHNERSQSIPDIEYADIKEIIDHHRVANVSTTGPVYFRNEPLGSTCTIISKMFFENGIRPSKKIAGALCAAIISDTLLFRSPTTTEIDKMMLERMSKIAGINPEEFAMEMFKAGTSLENVKPQDLLKTDVKLFTIEEEKVRVGQAFTMDLDNLEAIKKDLVKKMEEMRKDYKEDVFVFALTDIFKETSKLIVVGKFEEPIAEVFEAELDENSFMAPGILSRKKQIIPKLTQAITKAKSE